MAGILHQQINLRKTAPDTYVAAWHQDWTVASTLHGGCVAAAIHLTTDPTLMAKNQPDTLNLRIEFLPACDRLESTLTISLFKLGAAACTLQLQLAQNAKVKAIALATSTNFDKPLGPTVPTCWTILPPPNPKPDFHRVVADKPEENWIPVSVEGEIIPLTARILSFDPRAGFRTEGLRDTWSGFVGTTHGRHLHHPHD